jgi:glycosyltransferase involved in cell wall biosynthesis
MKILYTSACYDSSGYAEAARNYICALSKQPGVELALNPVSFENWETNVGEKYLEVLKSLENKKMDPDIQIIHLTPENFVRHIRRGVKNIGYTVWETSKLPSGWPQMINQLDEVWVPCQWNVEVFKESGVTIPVRVVPHAFDREAMNTSVDSNRLNFDSSKYNFYSIFQWNARKNPEGLLRAYWHEFGKDEDVMLILKTFVYNNSIADKKKLAEFIKKMKNRIFSEDLPPVLLVHDALSKEEINAVHKLGDAFVLPHRAEGWGIPHFESMAAGNVTIATGFSGNLEFMNEKNSLLVDYADTPCFGMDRGTYNGKMTWAEPDIVHLGKQMRRAFEGWTPVESPSLVVEKFSWENVGSLMMDYLGALK